jgi:hypothetical protein
LVIFIVVVVMLIVRVPIVGVIVHPVVVRPVTMAIIVLVPMPSNCDSNGHRSNTPRGSDDATRKADSTAHKQLSRIGVKAPGMIAVILNAMFVLFRDTQVLLLGGET